MVGWWTFQSHWNTDQALIHDWDASIQPREILSHNKVKYLMEPVCVKAFQLYVSDCFSDIRALHMCARGRSEECLWWPRSLFTTAGRAASVTPDVLEKPIIINRCSVWTGSYLWNNSRRTGSSASRGMKLVVTSRRIKGHRHCSKNKSKFVTSTVENTQDLWKQTDWN